MSYLQFSYSSSPPNSLFCFLRKSSIFFSWGYISGHHAIFGRWVYRLLPVELLVSLPVLSSLSHSCLSLHRMTTSFYGFTRTDGFLFISSLFLSLLQLKLSLPCLFKYYSSICILPSRNLWKCCYCFPFLFTLLLFLIFIFLFLHYHLMRGWVWGERGNKCLWSVHSLLEPEVMWLHKDLSSCMSLC